MNIILASQSPRRLHLLESAGFHVEVMPSHIDETPLPNESAHNMVLRLCQAKAWACSIQKQAVVAADTLVSIHGQALGQPEDAAHAKRMLQQLSGQTHTVLTAVCVRLGQHCLQERVCTDVSFRALSDAAIDAYIEHNEVLDKAGAYAIQGAAASFITRVDGALDNVIGLPVHTTTHMLKQLENLL